MPPSSRRRRHLAALVGSIVVVLSACSSPSEVSSSGDADASASGSAPSSGAAAEALQTAYTGQLGEPPTTPTEPPPDVDLWVVSCGEQSPGCAAPTAATREAAETVGWSVTVCDGQLLPDGWGDCVRQATSAGADVIIPIGIDCPLIRQPFEEARDAGVTVVGGGGADCDAAGGPKLWASELLQLDGLSIQEVYELHGRLAADWLIGRTDGQARVLQLRFTDTLWGPWMADGFEAELGTCEGCEILSTLEVSAADLANGSMAQKFSTALLEVPDANAVLVPLGGFMPFGLAQAVVASGRSDDLAVITGLGSSANLDLIRSGGGQDAIVGYPTEWGAWGSVDTAIRVLNGEEPLVQGNGVQVVDAENNMPAPGEEFTGGVNYRAAYTEAWGV